MNEAPTVRLATIDELLKSTVPNFLAPPPSRDTLRNWFKRARVPCIKANPTAKRGGGKVWFNVAAVEKLLRRQIPAGN